MTDRAWHKPSNVRKWVAQELAKNKEKAMPEVTPKQAITTLYAYARRAPLTADEHDNLRTLHDNLQKAVTETPAAPAPDNVVPMQSEG